MPAMIKKMLMDIATNTFLTLSIAALIYTLIMVSMLGATVAFSVGDAGCVLHSQGVDDVCTVVCTNG